MKGVNNQGGKGNKRIAPEYFATVFPSAIKGVFLGAALGGAMMVVKTTLEYRKRAPEVKTSFKTETLQSDPELLGLLIFLQNFQEADPDMFEKLVRGFNQLVSLYGVIRLRETQVSVKFYSHAEKLKLALDSLMEQFKSKIERWHPRDLDKLEHKNMDEVDAVIEQLAESAENYVYNINLELSSRY
jgi:hypothetical protein